MTAQKLADDIKANAERRRSRIVREAQGRSDLLLEKTQARLEDVQREIDGLKLKRRDVETSIEATIQTLRNTLEFVREQEDARREDKILLHRPRHAEYWSAGRAGIAGSDAGRRLGRRHGASDRGDARRASSIDVRVDPRANDKSGLGGVQRRAAVRSGSRARSGRPSAANDAIVVA